MFDFILIDSDIIFSKELKRIVKHSLTFSNAQMSLGVRLNNELVHEICIFFI